MPTFAGLTLETSGDFVRTTATFDQSITFAGDARAAKSSRTSARTLLWKRRRHASHAARSFVCHQHIQVGLVWQTPVLSVYDNTLALPVEF